MHGALGTREAPREAELPAQAQSSVLESGPAAPSRSPDVRTPLPRPRGWAALSSRDPPFHTQMPLEPPPWAAWPTPAIPKPSSPKSLHRRPDPLALWTHSASLKQPCLQAVMGLPRAQNYTNPALLSSQVPVRPGAPPCSFPPHLTCSPPLSMGKDCRNSFILKCEWLLQLKT